MINQVETRSLRLRGRGFTAAQRGSRGNRGISIAGFGVEALLGLVAFAVPAFAGLLLHYQSVTGRPGRDHAWLS